MNYTIETLTTAEIPPFFILFKEILSTEFPGYSPDTIQLFLTKLYTEYNFSYYLEKNMKTIFIVKNNTEMIGFAVIDEPYGGVSLLRWLGIQKVHQRKGIGKNLIEKWLYLATTQNCHKAEVAAQPEAKEFYAKAGLILEGHRIKSYFGIDQYIFGKVL